MDVTGATQVVINVRVKRAVAILVPVIQRIVFARVRINTQDAEIGVETTKIKISAVILLLPRFSSSQNFI